MPVVVQFSPDQQMAMLEWLENQRDAKLDLNQIIEGLKNGYFTVRIVSDSHARFSKPSEDIPRMSETV